MLFTPEIRSSKYSSKWCGFLSCCLCPSVAACFFPACWLLCFIFSLHFGFTLFLFISCHLWGLQSWGCLNCLSVTGRYTCQLLWLTTQINSYTGSVYTGHEILYLLQSGHYSWPYLSLSSYHDNLCAGRASQNWIYGYGSLLFILLCLKGLPRTSHSHTLMCHLLTKTNKWVPFNLSLFSSCPLTCF